MLRRTLVTIHLLAGTTLTAFAAADMIKERLGKIADMETAHTPSEYVMIRFARGEYNGMDGLSQMRADYKLFRDIVPQFRK
uniref:Uncharacterized protein n=1 Tax=Streptomyces phage Scarif TaxID=3158858 RepID=A0AAU7GX52_9CAUD